MFVIRDNQYYEMRKNFFTEKLLELLSNDRQKAKINPVSNEFLITDINEKTTQIGFDKKGFIAFVKSPLRRTYHFENDVDGKMLAFTNPNNSRISFDYNLDNDIEHIKRDGNSLLYIQYETKGFPDTIEFSDNTNIQFGYNRSLKITSIKNRINNEQKFEYDLENDLTSIKDEKGYVTRFYYSSWNHPDKIQYADGVTEYYKYNSKGLLTTIKVESETIVDIAYNDTNQPTNILYEDGNNLYYDYNDKGRIAKAQNNVITNTYTYNKQGQLIKENQEDKIIEYHYGNMGQLLGLTYPSGDTVHFQYDDDDRLESINDWSGNNYKITYDDKKNEDHFFYPNNLVTTIRKSKYGFIKKIECKNLISQNILYTINYDYDNLDRLKTLKDSKFEKRSFKYDNENQLLSVSYGSYRKDTYLYDAAGNRTKWNDLKASFNKRHQLVKQGNTLCSYDTRGNMIKLQNSKGTWQYSFNKQNCLIRAESSNGIIVTFSYDAFGRRIWKRCGSQEIRYLWMGEVLIGELIYIDKTQVVEKEYLYKPGTYIPLLVKINNKVYFYHTDHLGTPWRLIDMRGKIVWEANYCPFGQAYIKISEVTNNLRFPGQYWDEETKLHYNRFRYYSPEFGRYISKDPIGYLAGLNNYIYVGNNPVNIIDPTGLWWKAISSIALGIAAAAIVVMSAPVSLPLLAGAAVVGVGVGLGVNKALNLKGFCLSCILISFIEGFIVGALFAAALIAAVTLLPATAAAIVAVGVSAFAICSMLEEHFDLDLLDKAEKKIGLEKKGYDFFDPSDQSFYEMNEEDQGRSLGLLAGMFAGGYATSSAFKAALPKVANSKFGEYWTSKVKTSKLAEYVFPKPNAKTDTACKELSNIMERLGISKSKNPTIGAAEYKNGKVKVALSGKGENTARIRAKVEPHIPKDANGNKKWSFATDQANTNNFKSVKFKGAQSNRTVRIKGSDNHCVEAKLSSDGKPKNMSVFWRGTRPNPYPTNRIGADGSTISQDMSQCPSCKANIGNMFDIKSDNVYPIFQTMDNNEK